MSPAADRATSCRACGFPRHDGPCIDAPDVPAQPNAAAEYDAMRAASATFGGPTPEAYTAAVRAIEKHRNRADQLRAALDELAGMNSPARVAEGYGVNADMYDIARDALAADDAARETKP